MLEFALPSLKRDTSYSIRHSHYLCRNNRKARAISCNARYPRLTNNEFKTLVLQYNGRDTSQQPQSELWTLIIFVLSSQSVRPFQVDDNTVIERLPSVTALDRHCRCWRRQLWQCLPERDYVTFGSLLLQLRQSVCCRLSSVVCLLSVCNVGAPYSAG